MPAFQFKRGVSRLSSSRAPDGGWGWLVVLGSFLLQALTVGITYTFGVIYVELLDYFQKGDSATAWIGSIQPALLYFIGVFTGPMLERFGWRLVVVVGGVISSAGLCLSYFANNIYTLYVTYGAMSGIGFGMMYVTSMVTVQHYFDQRRALATGLAVSGSGVGTLCFGIFTQYLLDTFHWRWTLVIQGGISLVVSIISASLFRAIDHDADDDDDDEVASLLQESSIESQLTAGSGSAYRDTYNTFAPAVRAPALTSESDTEEESSVDPLKPGAARRPSLRKPPGLPGIVESDEPEPSLCCRCASLCQSCDEKFQLSLCKNPRLLMYCFTVVFFCFGYHVPYSFTPTRAIDAYGLPASKASFLVSAMGIANVVFRLMVGWIGDKSPLVRFVLMGSVLILCGLNSILSFLYTNFALLIIYSSLFGAFSGCFASMYPVVMVDLMGLEVIDYTVGLGLASSSIAFLVASPISGWVISATGGFDAAFYMVGSAQIVGGLLFFSILLLPQRYYPESPATSRPSTPIRRTRVRVYSESIA